jgi:uncharacterized membrane protein
MIPPPLYLLHPVAVHFPIALLTTGLMGAVVDAVSRRRWSWVADGVSWLLWLGTASAGVAAGLGLLAENTAPHVPPAWETLALHETLAYWTVGLFTVLSLWRFFYKERWPRAFVLAWLLAVGVLLTTGYQGGELVFTHNMGTAASVE